MRISVTIPDTTFHAAEKLRGQRNMSRSDLYAHALRTYLIHELRSAAIIEQLNKALESGSDFDPVLERAAIADLPENDWK